jgi:hypothetical protein
MIPEFNAEGNLPPGIHWATWEEFSRRFGINPQRRRLLAGLRTALRALQRAGCPVVYINGSFVTSKEEPQDWDGCWEMEGVDFSKLDPVFRDLSLRGRAIQKAKYGGEFFPIEVRRGDTGFLGIFQEDNRTGSRKGIIAFGLMQIKGLARQRGRGKRQRQS